MSRFFKDIKKFFNYTVFSSKAELKSEVAGSFLSWLWWILDPFFFMLVYSFIAILVFKSGEPYFRYSYLSVLTVGSSSARLLKAA